jgi:hypothetical protein
MHIKKLFSILFLFVSMLTGVQAGKSDFCLHSFEEFAYEGPRNPEEPPQLPRQPWQSVYVENVPENYLISHVEIARQNSSDTEIWLNAGTAGNWTTEIYTPEILKQSKRSWLVYNSQTHQTKIVPAGISGTDLAVYNLFVDTNNRLWGSVVPLSGYTAATFPVLSVLNESVQQFELVAGMLELPSDDSNFKVIPGRDNIFWILVAGDALYSVNTSTLTFHRWIDLADIELLYATIAPDGTLYFSTHSGDYFAGRAGSLDQEVMYQFVPETGVLTQLPLPSEWPIYRGLLFGQKGQLWLGSIGFRDTNNVWTLLHTNIDLFFRDPMMGSWLVPTLLLESSDGRLWYTNWWDGGIWWKGSAWYNPNTGEGCMFTNYYSSIVEDNNKHLWMVADGKLYIYRN